MKQIFISLSNHIIATIAQIKIVDLDRGQLLLGNTPSEYPAAFIGISYPTTESIDDDHMIYEINISIRIAFDGIIAETSSLTPIGWRNRSLSMLDMVDDLASVMQRFKSELIATPALRSITPEYINGLTVYTLSYTSYCDRQ